MQTYDCFKCYTRGNEVEKLSEDFREAYSMLLVRNNVLSAKNEKANLRIAELEELLKAKISNLHTSKIAELEAELAKAKLSNKGMHKTIERLTDTGEAK